MFAGYRHCKKCGKALMGLFDGALCDECEEEENRRMKDYEQIATNIMMTALEGVKAQIRKVYDKGYKDGKADTPFTDTEEAEDKAYTRGLNTAWECARKLVHPRLGGYTEEQKQRIFGTYVSSDSILHNFTAPEVIAKIKAYEDKQKQDAEIKVGDEVYSDAFDDKGIVTHKKYGKWVLSGGYWRCSECKEKALLKLDKSKGGCREYEPVRSKHCPSCGVKMQESEEE